MDSPHSVMSPLKRSCVFPDSAKQNPNHLVENPSYLSREINFQTKETIVPDLEEPLGALEVHIHQARDIHNICIYQKQDVYAKLCLTSDPENSVSTKTINGAGQNPVFDEKLRLNVGNVDSSLKCEIWMLSRVRTYLEDQLLGFVLVPVSEILIHDGKLEKEFSLSSTDLFHSPAGVVELSVSYVGQQPEVFPIPAPSVEADSAVPEKDLIESLSNEFDKIEFPDPDVVNKNHQMVEEYYEIVDSQHSEGLVYSDTGNQDKDNTFLEPLGVESPPSSVSTTEISFVSTPVNFESSETPKELKSPAKEHVSPPKDSGKQKVAIGLEAESGVPGVGISSSGKPLVGVSIEPESEMVQQDIVDMYMKSMQQFTESLAKMKLPGDAENGPSISENSTSDDQKTPASKKSGSRVFYGSRAFF